MEILAGLLILALIVYVALDLARSEPPKNRSRRRLPPKYRPVERRSAPSGRKTRVPTDEMTPLGREKFQPQPPMPDLPPVISGRARIVDRDTIIIGKTRIRLYGIDAPEIDEPYGIKAKWAMVNICKGHEITATLTGEQSYERVVAHCVRGDGLDISEELVRQGLALDWKVFSNGCYREFEPPDARTRMWRQASRMGM